MRAIAILVVLSVSGPAFGQTAAENLATHRKIQARIAERQAQIREAEANFIPNGYIVGTGGPDMDRRAMSRGPGNLPQAIQDQIRQKEADEAAFRARSKRYRKYHRSLVAAKKAARVRPEDRK